MVWVHGYYLSFSREVSNFIVYHQPCRLVNSQAVGVSHMYGSLYTVIQYTETGTCKTT